MCIECVGRSEDNLTGVDSFLLPCEPQRLNSGSQIWGQASLPTEPSHLFKPRPLDLQCRVLPRPPAWGQMLRCIPVNEMDTKCTHFQVYIHTDTPVIPRGITLSTSPRPCQEAVPACRDLLPSPLSSPRRWGGPSVEQHQATGLHAVLKKAT